MNKKDWKSSLEFQTKFTKKKGVHQTTNLQLLPQPTVVNETDSTAVKSFQGIFTGISVEIFELDDIVSIYENGCWGKSSRSRSVPIAVLKQKYNLTLTEQESMETLVLSLEEACFLSYFHKSLLIFNPKREQLDFSSFMELASKAQTNFVAHMAAFLYLKSKAWVVKSGIKFGAHFLLYKDGPRYFHASFLVHVRLLENTCVLIPKNIRGLQRVAESSDKNLMMLEVCLPAKNFMPKTIECFHEIEINETVIRRFNMNVFLTRNSTTSTRKK